jgi:tRNA uridine 5-carboxymethylaminomethyl modification enzyme
VLHAPLQRDVSAFELLRRPEVSYEALLEIAGPPAWLGEGDDRLPAQVRAQIEVHARYAGYIERQQEEIERARRNEETMLPQDLDYTRLSGLSHEVRQKLAEVRPATLGQAARVPGVTPAAVSILLVHLKKRAQRAPPKVA